MLDVSKLAVLDSQTLLLQHSDDLSLCLAATAATDATASLAFCYVAFCRRRHQRRRKGCNWLEWSKTQRGV